MMAIKKTKKVKVIKATTKEIKVPTKEIKAPIKEEKAPIKEEKAPIKDEKAPIKEEKAPIKEEKAPIKEEKAPITEINAITKEINAPTEEKTNEMSKKSSKSVCTPGRVRQAVSILRQLNDKYYESAKKKPLLDDISEKSIFLQVTMKKLPSRLMRKCIKVLLPNSLVTEATDICLITGDLDRRNKKAEIEPDVLHYKEFFKKQDITQINEVLTLRQLRLEYKQFEARRQLLGAYDVFLCDKKIAGVLPKALGKHFFQKRKFPIQIDMTSSNLKHQVEKALSSTVFNITSRGTSCNSVVASLSMDDEKILENILAAIKTLKDNIPGKLDNVLGFYLKTDKSKAVPLYMSFGNPNEVKLERKIKLVKTETDELSTFYNSAVTVSLDGRVTVKRLATKVEDQDSEEEKADKKYLKKEKISLKEEKKKRKKRKISS